MASNCCLIQKCEILALDRLARGSFAKAALDVARIWQALSVSPCPVPARPLRALRYAHRNQRDRKGGKHAERHVHARKCRTRRRADRTHHADADGRFNGAGKTRPRSLAGKIVSSTICASGPMTPFPQTCTMRPTMSISKFGANALAAAPGNYTPPAPCRVEFPRSHRNSTHLAVRVVQLNGVFREH